MGATIKDVLKTDREMTDEVTRAIAKELGSTGPAGWTLREVDHEEDRETAYFDCTASGLCFEARITPWEVRVECSPIEPLLMHGDWPEAQMPRAVFDAERCVPEIVRLALLELPAASAHAREHEAMVAVAERLYARVGLADHAKHQRSHWLPDIQTRGTPNHNLGLHCWLMTGGGRQPGDWCVEVTGTKDELATLERILSLTTWAPHDQDEPETKKGD